MLVFTSCVSNYLPKARVLASSLKSFHPDWQFCLLLGDSPPQGFNIAEESFDRLLYFNEVGPKNFKAWQFKHTLIELCTAIKGYALTHFLEKERHAKVIYLDPDILVLDSLGPLEQMLDEHDILLTPHQLAPQRDKRAIIDNEICSLQHGIFNLGFLGCTNKPQGIAFSHFWTDRLHSYCRDDKENGLFTDQKWCDLTPAYFSRLGIIRDPGYNAASWNLTDRIISSDGNGKFLANDQPLRFYHFTGFDSGNGKLMSQVYGAQMPAVAELWSLYEKKLQIHQKQQNTSWSGNYYSNGQLISKDARSYFRDNPAIPHLYPDPYLTDQAGLTGFAGHWRKHIAREQNRVYVWARKPFRLVWLAAVYLNRHGGLKATPRMLKSSLDAFRNGGVKGLIGKIRKFKHNVINSQECLRLRDLLTLSEPVATHWLQKLKSSFSGQSGVLILDHMYGGGANDYREKRLHAFLGDGQPCLLATWDFFAHKLRLHFYLADGAELEVEAGDIAELLSTSSLHFRHILLNELVLWSKSATPQGNHHNSLTEILQKIRELTFRDNAELEIAIHDFYAICPCYVLLDYNENGKKACTLPQDMPYCRNCLSQSPYNVPPQFDLAKWRKAWQHTFDIAHTIDFFSNSTRKILENYFHFSSSQVRIVPHEPLAPLRKVEVDRTSPPRIAVIGHIASHKGADIVRDMAEILGQNEKLFVIGELEGPHPANITVLGEYKRKELPDIIERCGINACLVPSIWPETFCYVVQEIMQMGLPLVVFPLGAQAERSPLYADAQIAANISAESALHALRQLHEKQAKIS